MTSIVLASTSPARLRVLVSAGLQPLVIPSGIDERVITRDTPKELALALAKAKATAVAQRLRSGLVIGCDSLLEITSCAELAGRGLGKPASFEEAKSLWRLMGGQRGILFTGHCVVDAGSGIIASEVGATEILFASPSEVEIEAYLSTGEPMQAAGSFTLDGFGAWFIEEIKGDYTNVLGISLPLLRRLFATLNVTVTDLWKSEGEQVT